MKLQEQLDTLDQYNGSLKVTYNCLYIVFSFEKKEHIISISQNENKLSSIKIRFYKNCYTYLYLSTLIKINK